MNIPDYITDLTRADFAEIVAATAPTAGLGMDIQKKDDTIEIAISETQFKRMLWAFYHNGGFNAELADIESVSLDPQGESSN